MKFYLFIFENECGLIKQFLEEYMEVCIPVRAYYCTLRKIAGISLIKLLIYD